MRPAVASPPAHLPEGGARVGGSTAEPPSGNTGAENTLALHWIAGTAFCDVDDVLARLAWMLGESVVVLPSGARGYTAGYLVGSVRVSANENRAPGQSDMGVHVEIAGTGCEELGGAVLARIVADLGLRLSRVDVAVDGCGFTPEHVRDEWRADRVRTRCKVPENAREDRQWRTSDWRSNAAGDTFSMASRQSSQYARVYDSRGATRFELEIKHKLAATVGAQLVASITDPDAFRAQALGLIRRFLDFVDPNDAVNRSRCALLPWWARFVAGVETARVTLGGVPQRTVPQLDAWIERQTAPALAILHDVYGAERLAELVEVGRRRWTGRHRALARTRSPGAVPVAA